MHDRLPNNQMKMAVPVLNLRPQKDLCFVSPAIPAATPPSEPSGWERTEGPFVQIHEQKSKPVDILGETHLL